MYFSARLLYKKNKSSTETKTETVKTSSLCSTLDLNLLRKHINIQPKISFEIFIKNCANKIKYNEMANILLYNGYSQNESLKE